MSKNTLVNILIIKSVQKLMSGIVFITIDLTNKVLALRKYWKCIYHNFFNTVETFEKIRQSLIWTGMETCILAEERNFEQL